MTSRPAARRRSARSLGLRRLPVPGGPPPAPKSRSVNISFDNNDNIQSNSISYNIIYYNITYYDIATPAPCARWRP